MLIKIFSLKFDALTGGFDDSPVREFNQDKEILQVKDHLLIRNEIPYLVLVIKYYPFRQEAIAPKEGKKQEAKQSHEEWKKLLSDSDLPLFNQMRDWRSERCKKEGIPPYLIFTNQQLALIVKQKPQSVTELTNIEGVGRGKCEKYGSDVLTFTLVKQNE